MAELTEGLQAVLSNPVMLMVTEGICRDLEVPIPISVEVEPEYIRFTRRLNRSTLMMCRTLNVPTPLADMSLNFFEEHLNDSRARWVSETPFRINQTLNQFWLDVEISLQIAVELFHRGILSAQKASEDVLRLQITAGFQEVQSHPPILNSTEILPWAQEVWTAQEFSFPPIITDEEEYIRFTLRLNRKLNPMMCVPLGLSFGK